MCVLFDWSLYIVPKFWKEISGARVRSKRMQMIITFGMLSGVIWIIYYIKCQKKYLTNNKGMEPENGLKYVSFNFFLTKIQRYRLTKKKRRRIARLQHDIVGIQIESRIYIHTGQRRWHPWAPPSFGRWHKCPGRRSAGVSSAPASTAVSMWFDHFCKRINQVEWVNNT